MSGFSFIVFTGKISYNTGMKKVLLGMSGGVDSTAAAVLLRGQGFEVIGATMLLWRDQDMKAAQEKMAEKSAALASRLGIRHLVLDLSDAFYERIVLPFMESYRSGLTPNPCVLCNRLFKFSLLPAEAERALARECGASFHVDYLATGHYARVEQDPVSGEFRLLKAADRSKDQSYVLWTLKQDELARLLLPLGSLSKEEARRIAAEAGTAIPREEESQDICFISRNYSDLLRENGGFGKAGWFINEKGTPLAPHPGIARFTVGQRKKLGHSFGQRVSICDIDGESGNITVTDESRLYAREMALAETSFNLARAPVFPLELEFSTRYQQESKAGILETESHLLTRDPQRAPSPGQSCVFYQGERMIGGAVIVRKKQALTQELSYPPVLVREAPAKINLNLHIFDRGSDGLHELTSVMQTVSLHDLVTLTAVPANRRSVKLSADDPALPSGPENLAFQAASRWMEAAGQTLAVQILLEKRIPVQAGLGGGSSDAAAVLQSLQELAGPKALPGEELSRIALSLGSDVPFFLCGGRALVSGTGGSVRPLPERRSCPVLLVKPAVSCSTADMFRQLDRARAEGLLSRRECSDSGDERNDFQEIAQRACPEIAQVLNLLGETGAGQVSLCGSGSACFALFAERAEAEAAASLCAERIPGVKTFVCETRAAACGGKFS